MTEEDREILQDISAFAMRRWLNRTMTNASETDRLHTMLKLAAAMIVVGLPGDRNQLTDQWSQIFRNHISENFAIKARQKTS